MTFLFTRKLLLPFLFFAFFLLSCKKEKEIIEGNPSPEKLFPLEIGKIDYYRLDSLTIDTKDDRLIPNHYLVMEIVTDKTTDNLNQTVWRIERYITKDTTGKSEDWKPAGNYFVALRTNRIETIENNLRFIKAVSPLKLNLSWKGNSYIPIDAYQNLFEFSIDNNMANWNYTYAAFNDSVIIQDLYNQQVFNKVTTIVHIDQSFNVNESDNTILSKENFATREKSWEQYAEGVGLIFREQILWEYQPNRGNLNGYLLKMWKVNL